MKSKWEWIVSFFPALLAMIIVTALDAAGIINFKVDVSDVDTMIILSGLIVTIVVSSILLSRESVRQMRLSSLRQAQQEYDAERNRFLRRLDHELKNPLTGIRLAVNNMADAEDCDTRRQLAKNIDAEMIRLNHMVIDLRKIAALSTRKLEVAAVNLKSLLKEIYTQALEEFPDDKRDIQLSLPGPSQNMPDVLGDHDLLMLALYNLLTNALKYTQPGDTVTLSTFVEDNVAVIEVRDTGIGIAAEDLPYIWDELYRSDRVRSIPGNGIGLALVKRIVERHGGQIEVQSQLDQGTTMRVCLPTAPTDEPVLNLAQPVSNR